MYERINHIMGDCVLSEEEIERIRDDCVAAQACRFGFIDYTDALECIKEAAPDEAHIFEEAIKNRDANKIGECVLKFIDCYAVDCAVNNIAEKVNQKMQELKLL